MKPFGELKFQALDISYARTTTVYIRFAEPYSDRDNSVIINLYVVLTDWFRCIN